MDKEQWLKAIKCSKEELMEWLNEMYEDEKNLREIIKKYENSYGVGIENIQEEYDSPETLERKIRFYTKVKAINFEYKRNWD